tara:strand:- start:648 stop:1637 length:990 start_codon:yes stop_codon:yes gene_type:complete
MNTILGINTSHNSSICLLTPEKNLFYFEEERYNREKYYTPGQGSGPSNTFFKVKEGDSKDFYRCISKHIIEAENFPNEVIVTSHDRRNDTFFNPNPFTDEQINDILKDQLKDYPATWYFFPSEHHIYHAVCGFHFSPFDEAICVVMDGGGGQEVPMYQEVESIYLFDKQSYEKKYSHSSNFRFAKHTNGKWPKKHYIQDNVEYFLSSDPSSGQRFSTLCEELDFKFAGHDAGKLMGLAAYGKSDRDPEGLAMKLQLETKESTIGLLEKAFSYSPIKNVVLSGGYALNCVNNYEYVKAFPEHNFFVDPVPHDGGTAIGATLWLDRYGTQR